VKLPNPVSAFRWIFLSPVARTGSVIPGTYLIEAAGRIEPLSHPEDSFVGGEFFIGLESRYARSRSRLSSCFSHFEAF
jgi:hypothetical protein